ncbi:hypothetical protein PRZ48_000694 [Zasmidium cellare]|uniref:Uncharacterized protein n=1 Tax=Zasmidium cellare TaxID=395010 RepID=A0ABR0F0S8_ZASCE|nr:hypothetical protein PRZ48_000694 [Zasmidium cellare]
MSRPNNRYSYDHYQPRPYYAPRSPTSERVPRYSPRSPVAKRRSSWPPPAFAEDEVVSLRRESNAQQLLRDVGKDEAAARGTIDQEPLIIDNADVKCDRRYAASDSERDTRKPMAMPTPPTSEDERARKARRKPSKLVINEDDRVPEMSKRTSSPYAFTKPTKLQSTNSNDRYSSRDTLTPPQSGTKTTRFASSTPSSPRRDSGRHSPNARRGNDYFNAGYAKNESAIDDGDVDYKTLSGKGKKVTDRPLVESPRVSAVDFAQPSINSQPIRKLNLDARRNTDTQNTLPTLGRLNVDKSRRPTPLMASTSLSEAQNTDPISSATLNPKSADTYPGYPRSRESSYASSRPVSPADSIGRAPAPGARSPRMSAEYSQNSSGIQSRPSSAGASRPGSPSPQTPSMESPRLGRTDLDWSALLAANAARKTKAPASSRLASTVPQEQYYDPPRKTSSRDGPPAPTSSLPYPEDSTLMGSSVSMPQEQDHAYVHGKQPSFAPSTYESRDAARSSSPAPSTSSYTSTAPARPGLDRARSAYLAFQQGEKGGPQSRPRPAEIKRTESFATSSEAKKELQALMKKGLPACPRPDPIDGYDDWYTVIGATNIDFCPECIDTLFERTVFRPHFRRSLPRNLNTKVRCAFGSPWIRLAWLLTLQQQRTDLSLLKDLAEIEDTTDPCPGALQTVQSWYGLRDPDGLFVRDFHVCFGDVRKIERLLPTLSGIFVKLPHRASYEKRVCAIRTDSNRFSTYLDALVSTHERAVSSRKGADPMPLIDLVERKTRLRECTKDNMLLGGLWHFAPDVPTMTVCEDCFESVVEPEIKKNSSVARKFNRTLQPVYGEGIGSSCQLYSRRMRKVFQRAVEDNDLKYLSRKSKERREAELWLQDRYKEVMRKAKRLAQEGGVGEDDERRLNRELEKISMEWKEKWE